MKKIVIIIISLFSLQSTAHSDNLDCSQPIGKSKKFIRCGKASFQSDIPLTEMKSISKIYPQSKVLSGDLDHDGIDDFVVSTTEDNKGALVDKVYILKGNPGGGYTKFSTSSFIEYGKSDIELRNQSFYIVVSNNTLKESNTETYQFKFRNGAFLLIGQEVREDDLDEGTSSTISTNFLTGVEIKSDWINGKKTGEAKTSVERKLLKLEDFGR